MPKVLIDIDESDYRESKSAVEIGFCTDLQEAVANGIVLGGLTNGQVLMKMFPDATITQKNEYVVFLEIDRYGEPKLFDTTWWNRKWKGEVK